MKLWYPQNWGLGGEPSHIRGVGRVAAKSSQKV